MAPCKTFRQTDSRWSSKPFPKSPYNMGNSGCGPTACADIVVSNPKYTKITPNDVRAWTVSNGYASYGDGTYHSGISAILKHYGFKVTRHDEMDSFWKEMRKSGRKAVILFLGGSRGGVTWTTGGHYVAATNYKIVNGKHYLYTRDPNGYRKNDGWHCYETTMKGLIYILWTCHLPNAPNTDRSTFVKKPYKGEWPKLPKRGYFKKGDKGKEVKKLQKFFTWMGYSIVIDGIIGPETVSAIKSFKKKVGLSVTGTFGPQTLSKAKQYKK